MALNIKDFRAQIGQGQGVVLELDPDALIEDALEACEPVVEGAAQKVLESNQSYLMSEANDPTGKLASEIKLEKSRFEFGGWAIEAQGPGNYDRFYATFVELGSINNPEPIPYLRTPLRQLGPWILRQFEGKLK